MRTNAVSLSRQLIGACVFLTVLGGIVCAQDAPKKVTKADGMSAATSKVQPEYPPMARQLKIEGPVELEAVVGESGAVEKVNIVSGNPMLTRPAVEALKRWKFAPFTADGKAVKALVPVGLNFKL